MTAPGTVIAGRYRLVDRVAAGGMGSVWEAWDELLQRPVAVKQLLPQPGLSDGEAATARTKVIREARITAQLHHPHAVTLYDVVEQDGRPCLIMQFVPSTSLSALLQEEGVFEPTVVARIGAELASALAAAHRVGIVHRDVKPGNVLITDDGSAKITDFGISHAVDDVSLTSTGMLTGTPSYLAPEVVRGARATFPADVFSLGATLYALLEGTPPFGIDQNPMAVLHRVVSGQMTPPRRSGPLTPLLLRMLAPEPADRPAMIDVARTLTERLTDMSRPPELTQRMIVSPPKGQQSAEPTVAQPTMPARFTAKHPTPPIREGASSPASVPPNPPAGALVAVILAVVLAGAIVVGFLLLGHGAAGQNSAPIPSATPSTGSRLPGATAPTSSAAAPATGTITPSSAAPTSSSGASSPAAPTSAELAAAITDYYALLPVNTDQGWARLTPSFQAGTARNRLYYQAFWDSVQRVVTSDATGIPPTTVEATITYYFKDGQVAVERTAYRLVRNSGNLKIDSSAVLSSQTRSA